VVLLWCQMVATTKRSHDNATNNRVQIVVNIGQGSCIFQARTQGPGGIGKDVLWESEDRSAVACCTPEDIVWALIFH